MSDPSVQGSLELSGFELQRRLGAGGMAEVYLAKKRGAEGTFKQLVVKRVLPEHSASRRFRNMFVEEAHLATRLNHPNIVQVYEFAEHPEGGLLLSMEYVEGVDLGQLIRAAKSQGRAIDPWVSAFIVSEVSKGLHYAHERRDEGGLPLGIVHRDVSPQNILLSYGGVVKIADFGVARANLFREEPGVLKGKSGYMSPEQARGEKVDRRSDIYALGVVLYELLALRSPYGPLKDAALLEAVRASAIASPSAAAPGVPAALEEIVLRAMARKPAERFQTAREMSAAIARVLLGEQQLIDSTSVEAVIGELLGREAQVAELAADPVPEPQTMAAVRKARTAASDGSLTSGTAQHLAARIVREVRHVAVLTLRLEGFEALTEALGELQARRVLGSTRSTLDDIAYKRGAVWSWSTPTGAQGVVGLMANPGRAPSDAAAIALDTHEFLASHSEDLPVPLRASIGIVRGIAAGERDDHGHLVQHALHEPAGYLAEQLGARTPFGKTWVAGGVYRLVRRDFRWSDGPTIRLTDAELHKVPDRMRAYVLLRRITADEHIAEMAMAPSDLVGRDAEKADLQAAYHRAVYHPGHSAPPPSTRAGTVPQVVGQTRGELVVRVLVGEMGIGKTALVDAFASELPEDCRAVRVECSPVKIDLPYATVADLLREITGTTGEDSFDEAVAAIHKIVAIPEGGEHGDRLVSTLAELVSGRQIRLHDEDAALQHHDLIAQGMRVLIGAVARSSPVVIVVDGLQWADRPSLDLLGEVLRPAESIPVLVLLLARPDERVDPYVEGQMRIELGGLQDDEQVRLVQARLGAREGVWAVCRDLLPRVRGNPYFMLEMVDALLERGALEIVERQVDAAPDGDAGVDEAILVRHDDRFGDSIDALPSTIEQLVGDRLRELPPVEHDVVDWLAVAGGPLSEADLLALTRLPDNEALMRLCARGLCEQKGRLVHLRHPLARDVAYQTLDPVQRTRMHRRLGEHLGTTPYARGLSAAIVAQHLERGEAPRQAAELYLEAAHAARDAHQNQLGLRYYQRVLDLLPPGDRRRLVAHEALENFHRQLGQSRERRAHLGALRRLARESRQARWIAIALSRTARCDFDEGAYARGLPYAQRAADLAHFARQPDIEVEAFITLCELLRDLGDVHGALAACERALGVASSGDVSRHVRAEVLRAKGVLLRRVGRLHAAIETHAEAIAVFKAEGARRSEARARNALGFALFALGRFEDTIAMCLSSVRIDLAIGGRFQVAKTLSNIGMSYARLGDYDRGLDYLRRAREAHERYQDYDSWVDTLLVTSWVHLERGQIEQAEQLYGDARALNEVAGAAYDKIHERIVCALIARARGQLADAAPAAAEARDRAAAQALESYGVYATAVEAACRVDLGETAAGLKLAHQAMAAVEAMEGSEYGIEVRSLCCEAVLRAEQAAGSGAAPGSSPEQGAHVCQRAMTHVEKVRGFIRDPVLRDRFLSRPPVHTILDHTARASQVEIAR